MTLKENDRRSYFRLEDKVYVEYAHITHAQAEKFSLSKANHPEERDEDNLYLDSISRQLSSLLGNLQADNVVVAQCIDLLNRKMDYIAGVLFFDKYRDANLDTKGIRTSTVDISEGGMSFNVKKEMQMGEYLRMKITIVSARLGFETVGKVVNCRALQHGDISYYRAGVEFPYLHESDRRSLARYIMDRQREKIRANSKPTGWEDIHN